MAATVAVDQMCPPWSPTKVLEATFGLLIWTHPHLSLKLDLVKRNPK